MLFILFILLVVGLAAGTYSESDRVLTVIPKSTLLMENVNTDRVQSVTFRADSYAGSIYKCNSEPPYLHGFEQVQMSRPLSVGSDRYEYYQLNLNRDSYIEYSYNLDRAVDFYLLKGKSEMNRFADGYSFDSVQYNLNDYRGATKYISPESDSYFYVFENLSWMWTARGTVNFNAFLKVYDVNSTQCELQCRLDENPNCKVNLQRYSNEVIILKGCDKGDWTNDITQEQVRYPLEWSGTVVNLSIVLIAISALCLCLAATIGCMKKGSHSDSDDGATARLITENNNSNNNAQNSQNVNAAPQVNIYQQAPQPQVVYANPPQQQPQQYVPQQQPQQYVPQQAPNAPSMYPNPNNGVYQSEPPMYQPPM
ncbi:hypothetical protein P9112_012184 [Eukaryota sp. TZLM1-RC]